MEVKNIDLVYSPAEIIRSISRLSKEPLDGDWLFNLADLSLEKITGRTSHFNVDLMGLNGVSELIPDDPEFCSIFDIFENIRDNTPGFHISNMWVMCVSPKTVSCYISSKYPIVILPLVASAYSFMVSDTSYPAEKLVVGASKIVGGKFAFLNGNMEQRTLIFGASCYEIH